MLTRMEHRRNDNGGRKTKYWEGRSTGQLLPPEISRRIYIYINSIHTHTHTHTHIYIYIYKISIHTHTHTHTHIYICIYTHTHTQLSRYSDWLRAGRSGIESRWRRDFTPVQTGPAAHPASCKMGTGSFPGVKCGRSVLLTTHHLLVPRSWKSRAIPLPTLWATPGL